MNAAAPLQTTTVKDRHDDESVYANVIDARVDDSGVLSIHGVGYVLYFAPGQWATVETTLQPAAEGAGALKAVS